MLSWRMQHVARVPATLATLAAGQDVHERLDVSKYWLVVHCEAPFT